MLRLCALALCTFLALITVPGDTQAQSNRDRRVALVIGNGEYQQEGWRLVNPAIDARLVADALRRAGFDVVVGQNVSGNAFRERLARFRTVADGAAAAVIYYAGIGGAYEGRQLLMPVDAQVMTIADIPFAGLDAQLLVDASRGARVRLVAFDACLSETEAEVTTRGSGGIVRMDDISEDDVMLLQSTQPGREANDGPPGQGSPFARAFAKHIATPGLELGQIAQKVSFDVRSETAGLQVPYTVNRLRTASYLISLPSTQGAAAKEFLEQPRIALVIGVSDYNQDGDREDTNATDAAARGEITDLRNAVNDAEDIRDALVRLRFSDLTFVDDPTRQELTDAVLTFTRKAQSLGPDTITVVFYAGHGMQVNGNNFLVPVGAQLPADDVSTLTPRQAESLLRDRAYPLSDLMDNLPVPTGKGANLIILDACRNNPWQDRLAAGARGENVSRGFNVEDGWDDLTNTLVAFSTAPNRTADDGGRSQRSSPYTAALKARIEQPGMPVLTLINEVSRDVRTSTKVQTPWFNGAGINPVCLGPCPISG